MTTEEKELQLPKCPNCGSTERIAQEIIDDLEKQMKVPYGAFKDGILMPFPLFNPMRPPLILGTSVKVPVILIYLDVCSECKTIYCTKFNLIYQDMPVRIEKRQPPTPLGR